MLLYPEIKSLEKIEFGHDINKAKSNLDTVKQILAPDLENVALPTSEITSPALRATTLAKDILKDLIDISQSLNGFNTFDELLVLRNMVRSTAYKIKELVSSEMGFAEQETKLSQKRNDFNSCVMNLAKCFIELNHIIATKKNIEKKELSQISNFLDHYNNLNAEEKQKYRQYFAFIVGSSIDEMLLEEIEQDHGSRSRKFPYDNPINTKDEIAVLAQTMFTSPEILKIVDENRSLAYVDFLKALNDKKVIELVKFDIDETEFKYKIICDPSLIRRSEHGSYQPKDEEKFIIYSIMTDKRTVYTWEKGDRTLVFEVDGLIEYFLKQFLSAFKFKYYGDKVRINDSYMPFGLIYNTFSLLGIKLGRSDYGYSFEIPESENLNLNQKMSDSELTAKLVNWLLDKARKVEYITKESTDGDLETKSEEFIF